MQHSSIPSRASQDLAPAAGGRNGRTHRQGGDGERRARSHARSLRCHALRCEEADAEIRDLLRRL